MAQERQADRHSIYGGPCLLEPFHAVEDLVESALLLASLRRLLRDSDLPPLAPIRSLAYFHPVIVELQQQSLPAGYLDYLRLKFQKVAAPPRKAAPCL